MKLRAINEQDYELILDLDKKIYPTNSPVQLETIKNWYKKNPEFGMIYEENGKIVGVCVAIPLNKEGWKKLISGKLSEAELDESTLFDERRDKELGIHIYHLEKLDKNIREFYKQVLLDLSNITKNNKIIGFSGLAVADCGKGLMKRLGCMEGDYKCSEIVFGKRAEMLVLYPEDKSLVWDYLNKSEAEKAILKQSEEVAGVSVKGYDFNSGLNWEKLVDSFASTGFQATHLSRAIEIIKKMRKEKAFIYLGYTSNIISSGIREVIRYLVEHKLVDCLVTTGGGIEEDLIKCLGDFKLGNFSLSGEILREKGINRIGNILVPNSRYLEFERWIMPILEKHQGKTLTPSQLVKILGEEINDSSSIYYWAWKNNIPVYCDGIMDGSLGDMIYIFKQKNDLKIEISDGRVELNNSSLKDKTGMIILGSGIIKHSICNANLYRNGSDYAVYFNNAIEEDGSDAGARPDEAVSWGKIRTRGESIKVFGDITINFPIVVGKAFVD